MYTTSPRLWIMISGPYTAGTPDEAGRERNLDAMNRAAHRVLTLGHLPLIGVNMALPIIRAAGAEHFDAIMMPVSLALAERCDAVLRIGGPSRGADDEVAIFRRRGLPVFTSIDQIPSAS